MTAAERPARPETPSEQAARKYERMKQHMTAFETTRKQLGLGPYSCREVEDGTTVCKKKAKKRRHGVRRGTICSDAAAAGSVCD